ncbi:MAG TPA: hypothetical protein VJT15_24300 [Pyrinomonadaceae bacterium]|nr:hypothetical protein [Pyrinomonadaceae bacterium]
MKSGNGHRTETPDVSHIRNVEVTHETSDINVRAVLMFAAVLTITTVVVSFGLWFMFRYFDSQEAKERGPGPMALRNLDEKERLPPEPRLQGQRGFGVTLENGQEVPLQLTHPQAEYETLRNYWRQALQTGAKDQSGNVVGMPIEQAMKQIVSGEGLPVKTKQAPDKPDDYAISIPTDTSSGRETVKLR